VKSRLKLSLKTTIFAFVGVIALLLIVPIPINIEAPALEIMYADPSHMEERIVTIRGWFGFNVMVGWHGFTGTIEISGYPEDDSLLLFSSLRLFPRSSERWSLWGTRAALLFYVGGQDSTSMPTTRSKPYQTGVLGMIYATPFFRQPMLIMRNDNRAWSPTESPVIVLNANTREEALLVLRRNHYRND